MRNIYIVRHTESVHHIQRLGGGWYDTSLTEKGRDQAAKIAASLHDEINLSGIPIYSSDLKRCAETADIFSKVFKSAVTLDRNLREMNFGDAGGKTKEWQVQISFPNRLTATGWTTMFLRVPNRGESAASARIPLLTVY